MITLNDCPPLPSLSRSGTSVLSALPRPSLPSMTVHLSLPCPDLERVYSAHRVELPSQSDVDGAVAAILRLQRMYKLSTSRVYAGDYSGYAGPALSPLIAYALGSRAFTDGMLEQSEQWLQLAADRMQLAAHERQPEMTSTPEDNGVYTSAQKAATISLLGRVNIYVNDDTLLPGRLRWYNMVVASST